MERVGERELRVALERGRTWVFASAVDWPGWCRRAKGEEAAVQALLDYADRYAPIAGVGFSPGEPTVIGVVPGSASTDFGAPGAAGPWDDEPLAGAELDRQIGLLASCWTAFDAAVAASAAQLRKGPRGGGRDRDAVVDHVRESERSYGRSIGVRVPPRAPWTHQRAAIVEGLRTARAEPRTTWSPRYFIRRTAWHVLDHAWEIQDKQP